jgi:WD40 repeat protein
VSRLEVGITPRSGVVLFPPDDLPANSPLNVVIDLKTKQPVPIATLHKNIKSSGYAKKPEPSRLIKKPTAKKAPKKPVDAPIVVAFKAPKTLANTFTPHEAPLTVAALSADGKRTVCADHVGTIVLVQQKSTPAYLGHTQPVTALSWNNQRGFVSASLDRTVKFWNIDRPDPLLTLNKTKSETRGTPFPDDITGVSYFWEDKFVALATGLCVKLFGYHLPSLNPSARTVADLHQAGTYKCVKTVPVESGKIVSMTASNTPASPIALVATTAKSLHAVDFTTGEIVLDIETKHDRPLHTIIANYGGIFTPRDGGTPDLALTGAFDESFRLWDLRSSRCERTFPVGSRTVRVGCCFSPDSRFVALGTERLGFEVWDVAHGACVAKLKDDLRGVTVTWLEWNPANGRIHCGTENGLVKLFA